jgi:hypothetical protein
VTELGAFLLPVVPLLLLLACLLAGRYPGCEAIIRLSERLASPQTSRRAQRARPRRPQAPRSFAASGGLLIAFRIAQRPPPLAA